MFESILKIIGLFSTILIPILIFSLNRKNEKLKMIQNKVSDKKYETYVEFYTLFFDVIMNTKGLQKMNQNKLTKGLIETKKKLMIFGTDKVLKKFFEWEKLIQDENKSITEKMNCQVELFILIRKDMGNEKTEISVDDILKSILKSEEDYSTFKLQESLN